MTPIDELGPGDIGAVAKLRETRAGDVLAAKDTPIRFPALPPEDQAAQPGVRASWGAEFAIYTQQNVLATQRLLERFRGRALERFVYASSSSVYGDAERYPTSEDLLHLRLRPVRARG